MTDWRMRLRDADRALEGGVDAAAAERLRRSVLAAARAGAPRPIWSRTFTAAAATLALVCAALLTALQGVTPTEGLASRTVEDGEPVVAAVSEGGPGERQQLQFSTPGGTRIIWVFDPAFDVKGTLP
jgi:hypothetical protein